MRHVNIPVFIPHMGCPNDCVFCNQRKIAGSFAYVYEEAEETIRRVLSTVETAAECEIAFFGGSFTGIDRGEMLRLLDCAERYVAVGRVSSIRLSTRPDYIDDDILDILSRYHVGTVELGIQSMSAEVLDASKRGHTPEDTRRACRMIVSRGFKLVGQMMVGLPLSTPETELMTANEICRMGCTGARIYPTAVFAGTKLAEMTETGEYIPLTIDGAVKRSAALLDIFDRKGVGCIRVGLCEGEQLHERDGIIAGGYHEALGELAVNEMLLSRMRTLLGKIDGTILAGASLLITAAPGMTSKLIGQKKRNRIALQNEYNVKRIKVIENPEFSGYNIKIDLL